jgi:polysaccharide pyruvyl transferase WcaK-like protein
MSKTRADGPASIDGVASLNLDLTRKSRVLILGGYGVRNVGDEAILEGLLGQLPEVNAVRVVSRLPEETGRLHGVEGVSPRDAILALLRSDALIVGGGGMFSSDTGPFGRYIPLFCRLALLRGIPVAFHGVGIYPSTPPKLLESITALAPKLSSFTVRDAISADLMDSLGVTVEQIPDLAESMPLAEPSIGRDLLRSIGISGDKAVVGLCLTGIQKDIAVRLNSAVPELIESRPDIDFCFIPISQHPMNPRHNDVNLARELQARSPRMRILDGVVHPAHVQAVFTQLSAAICERFHSYIFAHRAGVPLIGVPYAEKCNSWLNEHGMEGVDLREQSLTTALSKALPQPARQVLAA